MRNWNINYRKRSFEVGEVNGLHAMSLGREKLLSVRKC